MLSDADKRAAYDRYGHAGLGAQGFGGSPFAGGVDLGDIFGDLFGEMFSMGGRSAAGARPAPAARRRSALRPDHRFRRRDLRHRDGSEDPAAGGLRDMPGHGQRVRARARACAANARGAGRCAISRDFSPWRGPAAHAAAAEQVIGDPCPACRGEGAHGSEVKLNVKVPPGVEEGTRIRYAGEGDAGRAGGPKGDLYVILSIRPHDFFERDGHDLYCVIPISFPQAALGDEFEIPGIDGPVEHQDSRRHAKRPRAARARARRSLPERKRHRATWS